MSTVEKLGLMLVAIGIFALVFVGILLIAARFSGRTGERVQAGSVVLPAVLFILVGLIYPAILTITGAEDQAQPDMPGFARIFEVCE